MKKAKNLTKTLVIALALLLTVALALGLSGAWYNASRRASGTITMTGGIIIDYSGFGQAQDGTWGKEEDNNISFLLFSEQENALPGASIALNNAGIKANNASVDFYARVKLTYKFYTNANGGQANDVTSQIASYSDFISTPAFASAWVDSNNNDGYYYYATGTTLNAIPKEATLGNGNYVDIFASSQSIVLNGEAEGFNHEGGGYQYNEDILIKRIEVYLTLETLQANQAAATANGWGIYVPPAQVVENSNSQVIQILANQITLGDANGAYKLGTGEAGSLDYDTTTLGNTLKIVVAGDSQINANAFENSELENVYIGDQSFIDGVSSYSARIYSTPATFIIGSNAFKGCTNLKLYLASGVNYTIYTNAIPSGATVYYNGSTISLPSSAGAVSGTTITMATPSIVTGGSGGSGSVIVSPNSSLGSYLYTDTAGLKWYFNLINNDTSAELKKCKTSTDQNPTGSISIPSLVSSSELEGSISVTSIGRQAFRDCNGLTEVTIPSSVTGIGIGAFQNCSGSGFTEVTIPSSVTGIGNSAFSGCAYLASVTIPSSVTSIGKSAFSSCTNLTSFSGGSSKYQVLDNGRCLVEVDGNNQTLIAFAPRGLSTYTIPSSVTSIGGGAFQNCYRLTEVTIGSSVTSIDSSAFESCTGLTSITIPSSVTSIGVSAFSGCTGLTSITIPSSVTSIGSSAFWNCTGLTSVTFDGSERTEDLTLGNSAFYNCSNLATVNWNNWPSGVTVTVDSSAFSGCTNLTNLQIPNQE